MNGTCNICDEPIMANPTAELGKPWPVAPMIHIQFHTDEWGAIGTNDDDHEAQSLGEGG